VEEKAAAEKAAAEKAAAEKAAADEAMRKAEQEIEQQKEAFKQDQSRYIGRTASGSWQCHGGWRHSKAVDDFQRCEAKQWARSRRFSIPPKHP
jgi:membrane protein involved in colicin uptake